MGVPGKMLVDAGLHCKALLVMTPTHILPQPLNTWTAANYYPERSDDEQTLLHRSDLRLPDCIRGKSEHHKPHPPVDLLGKVMAL